VIVEPPAGTTHKTKAEQITLPYDRSTQITKEYPPPTSPKPTKQQARVVEEPEIQFEWAQPDLAEVHAVQKALEDLSEPVPEGDASQKLASGSGPSTPAEGAPLVHPERKRAQSRPSMKAVLAGEIDTESELDVPTFIRRHSSQHG